MPEQQTWISDGGTNAAVDPAEVDAWRALGWAPADPPTSNDDWVHMWRDGIAEPARVPMYALRNLWGPRGWVAGPPPGGPHPFAPKPVAEPAPPKSRRSASSGEVKEETGG